LSQNEQNPAWVNLYDLNAHEWTMSTISKPYCCGSITRIVHYM